MSPEHEQFNYEYQKVLEDILQPKLSYRLVVTQYQRPNASTVKNYVELKGDTAIKAEKLVSLGVLFSAEAIPYLNQVILYVDNPSLTNDKEDTSFMIRISPNDLTLTENLKKLIEEAFDKWGQ